MLDHAREVVLPDVRRCGRQDVSALGYARRVEWPAAFYDRRAGVGCPLCDEGRPEATAHAVRFFAGEVSNAYPDPPAMPEERLMRDVEALRRATA